MTEERAREVLAAHLCEEERVRVLAGSPTISDFTGRVVAAMLAFAAQARAEERGHARMDVIRAYDAAQAECQRIITETKFAEDVTSDQREWFKRGAQACSAMISYVGRQVAFPSDDPLHELQALGQEKQA